MNNHLRDVAKKLSVDCDLQMLPWERGQRMPGCGGNKRIILSQQAVVLVFDHPLILADCYFPDSTIRQFCGYCGKKMKPFDYDYKVWLEHTLRGYHELVLTGGNTESFRQDLLTKN